MIGLLVFLNRKYAVQRVTAIQINIDTELDKQLLTEERILELINIWYPGGLVGNEMKDIDINDLEDRLGKEAAVERAQVSTQLNGTIDVEIEQRSPIIRFIQDDGMSFYMDELGKKIPVAGLRTARVPIALGMNNDTLIKKVYTLCTYVYENEFMNALTEQIFVNEEGDLIIIPKFHHHEIIVGDNQRLDEKFRKLEKFYKDGMMNIGWDTYKSINLKFKDQVVCN